MPRAKKSVSRKTTRRKASDRRRSTDNTFWDKVINGMKKLLSPAFK